MNKLFLLFSVFLLLVLGSQASAATTFDCRAGLYIGSITCTDRYGGYSQQDKLRLESLERQKLQSELAKLKRDIALLSLKNAAASRVSIDEAYYRALQAFGAVQGRTLSADEYNYWVNRAYDEQLSVASLIDKMSYYKSQGKTYPGQAPAMKVAGISSTGGQIPNDQVPAIVERIFQHVYGRKITASESTYWKNRARTDKRTEVILQGAMSFQKAKGVPR